VITMNCLEANNSIDLLRQEFAVRFFRWAELELQRELDQDFVRVRKVKSGRAFHYLEFLAAQPPKKRSTAAYAILRASVIHRLAREQLGITFAAEERELLQQYQSRFHPEARWGRIETQIRSDYTLDDFELDRTQFEKLLLSACSQALDAEFIPHRGLMFLQKIDGWYLKTGIDITSVYQVRYSQTITARRGESLKDYCPIQLKEAGVSFLGWLGVEPVTTFNLLIKSEMQAAAAFIAERAQYFASVAPALLAGLIHTIPEKLDPDSTV
jgi:hypothetical protein